jgi:hypothetical protein
MRRPTRARSTSATTRSRCRRAGLEALNGDPLKVHAYQYDLACNGYELISGGIRNHKPEIMFKAFELAGYPKDEVEKRFGGMVKAFKYGAPPHGGCAAGIDRIVMLLADEAEHPRGHHVPDEPARRRPDDGRPVGTHERTAARPAAADHSQGMMLRESQCTGGNP